MALTKAQRYNINLDAMFTASIILKHEHNGEYSENEYAKAKHDYAELKAKYPRLLKNR